jgi:hypothetical protein
MNLIQNHITYNFQSLAGTLSPAKALLQLVTDNYDYGVVLDGHSKPVALVTADDLEQADNQGISSLLDTKVGFPATIIVGCQVDMQDLVKLKGFIERYKRIRGVIAIDDNTVVGILAITTVPNYLKNRDYELRGDRSGTAGGSELPGRHQPPKIVSIKCSLCQCKDEFFFFDYDNPPDCKNPYNLTPPHKFKPS